MDERGRRGDTTKRGMGWNVCTPGARRKWMEVRRRGEDQDDGDRKRIVRCGGVNER